MGETINWEDNVGGDDFDFWGPEDGWPEFNKEDDSELTPEEKERKKAEEKEASDRLHYAQSKENERNYFDVPEAEKTPEAEAEAFEIYRSLGANRHNAVCGLMIASSEDIPKIRDGVEKIDETYESFPEKMRNDKRLRLDWHIDDVKIEYVRGYRRDVMTPEMNEALADRLRDVEKKGEEDPENSYKGFRAIGQAIEIASISRDGKMFGAYYDLFTKYAGTQEDKIPGSKYMVKSDLLARYATLHGLSKKRIEGFEEVVFPMVDAKDPEAESLMESANSWGTSTGEFGISDYTIHALTSEVTPRNVRDLMQIYRDIPTSDYRRFESNRRDALALQGVLWHGRDFIHDERPGVHAVLKAMVEFYDSKDDPEAHAEAEGKLHEIVDDRLNPEHKYMYTGFDGKRCFDLENYDEELATFAKGSYSDEGVDYAGVKAIEVLRRLEENTRQVSLEKPKSGDEELDGLIEKLEVIEKDDGRVIVDFDEVAGMVKRANEILTSRQYEIGIKPSFIRTLSYVERMATEAMRGVEGKDYKELPFDPGFKEIVKFNELTASGDKFSEQEFEHFWSVFKAEFGKVWEDNPEEGYSLLSRRVTGRMMDLARQYADEGKPRHMIDSVWSGNLSDELIGLVDKR